MCAESSGDPGSQPGEQPLLNIFALVIYIPDPLGRFLDDLRRELAPHYNPHAHVSVLPPRQLTVDWKQASDEAQAVAESWQPFEIELTDINTFPVTNVVYLEVGRGTDDLRALHERMNVQSLAFHEPFCYHPHSTVAQEIPAGHAAEAADLARRRWREFRGRRSFMAENAVFVQSKTSDCWVDLAAYSLGELAKSGVRRSR